MCSKQKRDKNKITNQIETSKRLKSTVEIAVRVAAIFSLRHPLFMVIQEDNQETSTVPKPSPSPSPKDNVSQSSPALLPPPPKPHSDASPKKPLSSKDFVVSVAASYASQPLQNYDPNVWGVLTAISNNARKRHQA